MTTELKTELKCPPVVVDRIYDAVAFVTALQEKNETSPAFLKVHLHAESRKWDFEVWEDMSLFMFEMNPLKYFDCMKMADWDLEANTVLLTKSLETFLKTFVLVPKKSYCMCRHLGDVLPTTLPASWLNLKGDKTKDEKGRTVITWMF